jgi:hypothetical protein
MATHHTTALHYLELLRTQQWCLGLGVPGPSEGTARTRALGPEEGAVQER